jgi:hypothetical protein
MEDKGVYKYFDYIWNNSYTSAEIFQQKRKLLDEWKNLEIKENSSLRGRVWKMLLDVPNSVINKEYYESIKQMGISIADKDIRNDAFRTFRGDNHFAKIVPEEKLS